MILFLTNFFKWIAVYRVYTAILHKYSEIFLLKTAKS
jgi:hypothetical protein